MNQLIVLLLLFEAPDFTVFNSSLKIAASHGKPGPPGQLVGLQPLICRTKCSGTTSIDYSIGLIDDQ